MEWLPGPQICLDIPCIQHNLSACKFINEITIYICKPRSSFAKISTKSEVLSTLNSTNQLCDHIYWQYIKNNLLHFVNNDSIIAEIIFV